MTTRYPFPIPFGWFCVGYPDDFPVGEPKALYYFGRHLVGWRDHEGEVYFESLGARTRVGWRVQFRPLIPGTGALLERLLSAQMSAILQRLAAYPFARDPA